MTPLRVVRAVSWLPWGAASFARARDEGKCVLLAIAAPWSAACRAMDERCYSDADIVAEINRWFVPVRVDADRRPDLVDRYELGGLPTTAFLDADGEILGGGTFVPPERFLDVLRLARQPLSPVFRGGRAGTASAVDASVPVASSDEDLTALVFSSFDAVHGGFGGAPKFPLVAPVRLALDLFRETGDPALTGYVSRTLDAMAWGGLYDEEEGGFSRCAAHADWTDPQREKLLGVNASLLDLYLEAGVTLGNERWLARAADTISFVQRDLALAPEHGWRVSAASDAYCLSDANAAMVSASLHASRVFEDDSLRELALQALEAVLLATYKPGAGVAHCRGGIRGWLSDHVAMITAHLDAWDLTGDVVYQMMAEELAQFVVRTMALPDGGFADRTPGDGEELHGLLRRPLKPFIVNCDAAHALHRLSRATGDRKWHERARQALEAVEPLAAAHGPLAAHFLTARRALAR